jgi:hypothetical protein
MSAERPELHDLLSRVERLEKQNRWLRRAGVGVLAAVIAVGTLGATYGTPAVPQKIVAHEFDVVGSAGKVRIRMRVSRDPARDATIDLTDGRGVKRVSILASKPDLGMIMLSDSTLLRGVLLEGPPSRQAKANAAMTFPNAAFPSAGIYLSGLRSLKDLTKAGRPSQPYFLAASGISMTVSSKGAPTITLRDRQGHTMDLGATSTVKPTSGATGRTSAASIVTLGNGKKHRVIWRAPQ